VWLLLLHADSEFKEQHELQIPCAFLTGLFTSVHPLQYPNPASADNPFLIHFFIMGFHWQENLLETELSQSVSVTREQQLEQVDPVATGLSALHALQYPRPDNG